MPSGPHALLLSSEKSAFCSVRKDIIGKGTGLVRGASGGEGKLESSKVEFRGEKTVGTENARKGRTTEIISDPFGQRPEGIICGRGVVDTLPLDKGTLRLKNNISAMISGKDES